MLLLVLLLVLVMGEAWLHEPVGGRRSSISWEWALSNF